MTRWWAILFVGVGLSAMGALSLCGWAAYQVGAAVRENREGLRVTVAGARAAMDPKGSGVPTVFNEARDITIAILKPGKPGHPETQGLIPAVRAVAVSAGAAVQTASDQVKNTQPLLVATAAALTSNSEHINKTVDAVTTATNQVTVDLQTANGSIAASKPLLEAYTASGKDLDKILGGPQIPATLTAVKTSSENVASISGDVKTIADNAAKPTPKKGLALVLYFIKSLEPALF